MKQTLAISTVNIIELCNGNLHRVTSFMDTPEGNEEAESLFKKLYIEHNDPDGTTEVEKPTEEDFKCLLDDGVYNDGCGYELLLTHSEV